MERVTLNKHFAATLLLLAGDGAAFPHPLDWCSVKNSGTSNALAAVAYGNDVFVTVGLDGIWTSPDGQKWTPGLNAVGGLRAVAHGQGMFVAVGNAGTILTSFDGRDWTQESSGTDASLNSVAFGNGLAVAVGTTGTILTSPDLFTWAGQTSGTAIGLKGVSYGNGLFVAVGGGFPNVVLTSPDGITWTERPSNRFERLNAISFGNGIFVAVGGGTGCAGEGECSDQGIIIHSADGTNWMTSQHYVFGILAGVGFGNGTFVVVGGGCAQSVWLPGGPYCSPVLLNTSDGRNWTGHATPTNQFLGSVAYGQGIFVAVGERGVILQSASFTPGELNTPRPPDHGEFQLSITGEIGRTYQLQTSTNLSTPGWTDFFSFTLPAPTTNLVDATAASFPSRFYRLVSP